MRPTHSPLPRLVPTISLPGSQHREPADEAAAKAKPPKKRSLNEAAHKLSH